MNQQGTPSLPNRIYHERQSKQLCALHTLNNLFQNPNTFTKQDLDNICNGLAPNAKIFNPHRSALGLGCYDVNVIITALAKLDYDVIWFDKRKDFSTLNFDNIFGFILNVPNTSTGSLLSPLNYIPMQARIWSSQKHWIAIRKIENYYYNLDSKLTAPTCIGNNQSLVQFLSQNRSTEQIETFLVISKQVAKDKSWSKAET